MTDLDVRDRAAQVGVLAAAVVPVVPGVDLAAAQVAQEVALVAGLRAVAPAVDPAETILSEVVGATVNVDLMGSELGVQADLQGMANAHQGPLETAIAAHRATATANAALMATDQVDRRATASVDHHERATENVDLTLRDLNDQRGNPEMVNENAVHMVSVLSDQVDLQETATEDPHVRVTANAVYTATDRADRRATATGVPLETATVIQAVRLLAGNGPNGSVGLSGEMIVNAVPKFRIR